MLIILELFIALFTSYALYISVKHNNCEELKIKENKQYKIYKGIVYVELILIILVYLLNAKNVIIFDTLEISESQHKVEIFFKLIADIFIILFQAVLSIAYFLIMCIVCINLIGITTSIYSLVLNKKKIKTTKFMRNTMIVNCALSYITSVLGFFIIISAIL